MTVVLFNRMLLIKFTNFKWLILKKLACKDQEIKKSTKTTSTIKRNFTLSTITDKFFPILLFPRQDDSVLPGLAGVDGPADGGHAELDDQMKDDDWNWQRNVLESKAIKTL